MQIELSKKEYGDLIDVLMIADAVLGGGEIGESRGDRRKRPLEQVVQKLYAQAESCGFGDTVKFDEKLRRFGPTADYEKRSDAQTFLAEYENSRFLEKLAIGLGLRDYEEIPTRERPVGAVERLEYQEELSDQYREDFEKNGIRNLRLFKE